MTSHFPLVEKENKLVPCSKGIPSLVEEIWNNSTMYVRVHVQSSTYLQKSFIVEYRFIVPLFNFDPPKKMKNYKEEVRGPCRFPAQRFSTQSFPVPPSFKNKFSHSLRSIYIKLLISALLKLRIAKPKLCHIRKSL